VSAVGVFAGRGDVIVMMGLAMILGSLIGWQLCRFKMWLLSKTKREIK
jgi:mannitol-specific phosphotransferase system IIBC component